MKTFIELIEDIIERRYRGSDSLFLRACGLRSGHLSSWRRKPDMIPHITTVQAIERGAEVVFEMSGKRPVAWRDAAVQPVSEEVTKSPPRSVADVYLSELEVEAEKAGEEFRQFKNSEAWRRMTDRERRACELDHMRTMLEIEEAISEARHRIDVALRRFQRSTLEHQIATKDSEVDE